MHTGISTVVPRRARSLSVQLARTPHEVLEAQALRYEVFVQEMGARLPRNGIDDRRDQDMFDEHCEHLLVRDDASGQVVGTYRILPADRARRVGIYYSEQEFDLVRLQHLRPRMVEVGRACIHADYRNGATIMLLWNGLARYMREQGLETLIGCASIGMADGGANALAVYLDLARKHLAPPEYRVFPRRPLPVTSETRLPPPAVPPLLKGYLRLGAWICGEPAWDPDFNTADLLVMLSLARVEGRYARHYLGEGAAEAIAA